jgi:hypothetical protein
MYKISIVSSENMKLSFLTQMAASANVDKSVGSLRYIAFLNDLWRGISLGLKVILLAPLCV